MLTATVPFGNDTDYFDLPVYDVPGVYNISVYDIDIDKLYEIQISVIAGNMENFFQFGLKLKFSFYIHLF